MTLDDEIAEAQSYITEPPKNESNTCDRVILPLLRAAGYARRDVDSRVADNTGQFPDYTLLLDSPSATWYLEAKGWIVPLEDVHAKQALNYANHNGKRFVVLTNGQTWRLYDNSIQGLLGDKLITDASLQDTLKITDFLRAISKSEVLSGGLGRYAADMRERKKQEAFERDVQRERAAEAQRAQARQAELLALLHSTLTEQLRNADSGLVLTITSFLTEQDDFQDIAPQTLSFWFNQILSRPPKDLDVQAVTGQTNRTLVGDQNGERSLNLKAIQGTPINGKNMKPVALHLPDETQVVLRSWVDFAEQAVRWLLQQSRPLPIPFESTHRSRWFLNHSPEHKRPDQRTKFKTVSANGKTVYMDADRTGSMFLADIYALCLALQIAPEEFRITVT